MIARRNGKPMCFVVAFNENLACAFGDAEDRAVGLASRSPAEARGQPLQLSAHRRQRRAAR